jgi:hypothetical protein
LPLHRVLVEHDGEAAALAVLVLGEKDLVEFAERLEHRLQHLDSHLGVEIAHEDLEHRHRSGSITRQYHGRMHAHPNTGSGKVASTTRPPES